MRRSAWPIFPAVGDEVVDIEMSEPLLPWSERSLALPVNDGTLWTEQPLYFQFLFAIDRVKALARQHPEWKDKEPFAYCSEATSKPRWRAVC